MNLFVNVYHITLLPVCQPTSGSHILNKCCSGHQAWHSGNILFCLYMHLYIHIHIYIHIYIYIYIMHYFSSFYCHVLISMLFCQVLLYSLFVIGDPFLPLSHCQILMSVPWAAGDALPTNDSRELRWYDCRILPAKYVVHDWLNKNRNHNIFR